MKAIMVMFDSLNRRMLSPYGCDWVETPNFQRLAEHAVTFDNCYVGSMPCMPARREIHPGRYNFLHRSWGPLEPFDDSMPELLKRHGIHSHLASDHWHYWEEGGCNYHTRYSTWEGFRGQETDPWSADLRPITLPESVQTDRGLGQRRQNWLNRLAVRRDEEFPQAMTFAAGMDFLQCNHGEDNWFLQIETFDPHEPYFCQQRFQDRYPHDYNGPQFDWPDYRQVTETPEQVAHCRYVAAALHSMCDHYLGRVLDLMDTLDLWKDTLLIVNTDHGFLLGEHDWWAKCNMPFYDEIAHTPLFIWDPRSGIQQDRRQSLVQTIDLPATLLEYFGVACPSDMQGMPLRETITNDTQLREAVLFGIMGGNVNCTNGRYVYMRAPATERNEPLFEYTLMPTHMNHTFAVEELNDLQLADPFSFTKGCRTMKIPGRRNWMTQFNHYQFGTQLFDLQTDPAQQHPLCNAALEAEMIAHMMRLMQENDAPMEQFKRLGI